MGWAEEARLLAEQSGDPTAQVAALLGLALAMVFSGKAGPRRQRRADRSSKRATELAEQNGQWWVLALAAGFARREHGRLRPRTAAQR